MNTDFWCLAPIPSFRPDHDIETIAFLEHQMAAAVSLNSPAEYKEWLEAYVQKVPTSTLLLSSMISIA